MDFRVIFDTRFREVKFLFRARSVFGLTQGS